MCDGKPYLCYTCHERFDCNKHENKCYWRISDETKEEGTEARALYEAEMYDMY